MTALEKQRLQHVVIEIEPPTGGMIGLTPLQARAMEIVRAARKPMSRYALFLAMRTHSRSAVYKLCGSLVERGHVALVAGKIVPRGLCFIAMEHRALGRPTAVFDRYPFLGHPTCAEWGDHRTTESRAA